MSILPIFPQLLKCFTTEHIQIFYNKDKSKSFYKYSERLNVFHGIKFQVNNTIPLGTAHTNSYSSGATSNQWHTVRTPTFDVECYKTLIKNVRMCYIYLNPLYYNYWMELGEEVLSPPRNLLL